MWSLAEKGEPERVRGVFDFLRSRNSLNRPNLAAGDNATGLVIDPMNAYNPLVSIYYLVREKIKRKRSEVNQQSAKHAASLHRTSGWDHEISLV
jgi:hypothetical protein